MKPRKNLPSNVTVPSVNAVSFRFKGGWVKSNLPKINTKVHGVSGGNSIGDTFLRGTKHHNRYVQMFEYPIQPFYGSQVNEKANVEINIHNQIYDFVCPWEFFICIAL